MNQEQAKIEVERLKVAVSNRDLMIENLEKEVDELKKKLACCVEALKFCECLNMHPQFNLYAVNEKARQALKEAGEDK